MISDYSDILNQFPFKGTITNLTPVREGHINTTLKAEFTGGKYILQKINTVVFTKPDELMANIFLTTEYLAKTLEANGIDPSRRALKFLKTLDGKPYYRDKDGSCWRSYVYIDNCYTLKENCSPEEIYKAAKAFGVFQNTLSGFDGSKLYESIKNFHNTPVRFGNFLKNVENDTAGRVREVSEEIEFFKSREAETSIVTDLLASGELPVRVTHNDTKINNILFDRDTKEALCIIDLDTIMPGSSLYDFGDSVRSGAGTAAEDEVDYKKMTINLDIYSAYVNGFLDGAGSSLTDKEIEFREERAAQINITISNFPYHKTINDLENKFEIMQQITQQAARRIKSENRN